MAKKFKKEDEERVQSYISKWRKRLYLDGWHFKTQYMVEDTPEMTFAAISAQPMYLDAVLNIFPNYWKESEKDQEQIIVHELCHCHTQPAWDAMTDLLHGKLVTPGHQKIIAETLTEYMAKIVFQDEW